MKNTSPFIGEYVDFLSGFLHDDAKTLNVVFDCSHGATGPVIDRLFPDSIILNGRPDGNFPNHAPDPLHAGSLDALQKKVVSDHADAGIIFDADGDRVFFVDDRGRFVDPDAVAYLLLWSLRPKRFVTDAKDGWSIRRQSFGAKRIASKTGHYFIKYAMRRERAELGYERSGHYYFKTGFARLADCCVAGSPLARSSYNSARLSRQIPHALHSIQSCEPCDRFTYYDSGIRAAIAVLNALAQLPYPLSDFVDLLPATYRTGEINIPVSSARPAALLARIAAAYKKNAIAVSKIDGIAMEFSDPDWWFNVRFSNTEPLVRVTMEAQDKTVYGAQLKKLTELLKSVT